MGHKIKIGLIGLGRAGSGMHIEELAAKTDRFEIVAVCDLIEDRVKKAAERLGCRVYTTIGGLLADDEVELVDIATRTSNHYEHAIRALDAGKTVLLEKPMCVTYEQAKDLFKRANSSERKRLYIRQQRRFEAVFNRVLDTVNSGILGEVFEININQLNYQRRDDWQTISEFGGGQLLNWGPHIIDHSLRLLGAEPVRVTGELRQIAAGGDCEDHVVIHFRGDNGRTVNMCISGGTALNCGRSFTVYGDRGAMQCTDNDIRYKYIDPQQALPPVVSDPGTPGDSFGSSGTFAAAVNPEWIERTEKITSEDLTVVWDYLYDSIRNGKDYPIHDGEVLEIMKTISAVKAQNEGL